MSSTIWMATDPAAHRARKVNVASLPQRQVVRHCTQHGPSDSISVCTAPRQMVPTIELWPNHSPPSILMPAIGPGSGCSYWPLAGRRGANRPLMMVSCEPSLADAAASTRIADCAAGAFAGSRLSSVSGGRSTSTRSACSAFTRSNGIAGTR